jgi:predicted alpha/beta superfamily hydrolase
MHRLLLAVALLIAAPVAATPSVPLDHLPALKGDYFPLASKATGTTYHIYVRLPLDYAEQPAKRYPIVYLLDGDSAFPMLAPQHLFMTIDDKTPEAILVGVAYGGFGPVNRRERDFGEGAPAFQRFLSEELRPEVERRVRGDTARRIIVGQSFGGTFVLWSAPTRPDLFWGHVASNPSFRHHQERLLQPAAAVTPSGGKLALVSGTLNNAPGRAGAQAWHERHAASSPWTLRRFDIEGGTHAADLGRAYRLAVNWMLGATEPR